MIFHNFRLHMLAYELAQRSGWSVFFLCLATLAFQGFNRRSFLVITATTWIFLATDLVYAFMVYGEAASDAFSPNPYIKWLFFRARIWGPYGYGYVCYLLCALAPQVLWVKSYRGRAMPTLISATIFLIPFTLDQTTVWLAQLGWNQ